MGEAGQEAIMPLKRMPSGNLGVEAGSGSNNPPSVSLVVNNNTGTSAKASYEEPKWNGEEWVIGVILEAMSSDRNGFSSNMKAAVSR